MEVEKTTNFPGPDAKDYQRLFYYAISRAEVFLAHVVPSTRVFEAVFESEIPTQESKSELDAPMALFGSLSFSTERQMKTSVVVRIRPPILTKEPRLSAQ